MIDVSRFLAGLQSKRVAVFGLGLSGLATVKALLAAGATVYVDDDDPDRLEAAVKVGCVHEKFTKDLLRGCGCLVLSPGVPLNFPKPHPVVKAARDAEIGIICDIELLHRCNHGRKTIGVTGTNGKSTTVALIAHILNEAGIEAVVCGNIGKPVLDIDLPGEGGVLVIEVSSYQMDLCPIFRPDIAVILDITPDHIDRHGTFKAYKATKMRMGDGARKVIQESETLVAATKVANALGVPDEQIAIAISSFKGLAHRQQFVRRIGDVDYINDSKATNAEACMYALKNYNNIYLIAGGLGKFGGMQGIEKFRDKIRHIFLVGEDMGMFSTWLRDEELPYTESGTVEQATRAAHEMAQAAGGGTVLLSPACASFDQFQSFEKRGEHFMMVVEAL